MTLPVPKSMVIVQPLCNQDFLAASDMVDHFPLLETTPWLP